MIITHPEKAVATLAKLKERGISITVDDFGTGYSSLSYLARLPIEAVKIDQRFVHGLEHNSNDVAITQAIIALSHSLGLRVIAEGVETSAQFEFLKSHGCEAAQGFLIARPLEEPEFLAWWKAQEEEARAVARCSPTCGSRKAAAELATPLSRGRPAGRRRAACRRRRRRSAPGCRGAPPRPTSRPSSPVSAASAAKHAAPKPTGCPRWPRWNGAATAAPSAIAAATRAIVAGSIHGMSPSATTQPAASRVASTPHARLAPIPSSAFAQRTMRAPAAPSAAASAASSGPHDRDDARQRREEIPARHHADAFARRAGRATARRRIGRVDRTVASSLSPPKRSPRPAASRMPTTPGTELPIIAAIGRARAIRHAPRRRGPTTTPTGNCSRRASRSRRRPRR